MVPASPVALFDTLLDVIYAVNPFLFSQLVLVGDVNVNMLLCFSYEDHIVSVSSHFNLTPVVVNNTYVRDDGYQLFLDLVIVSDSVHVLEYSMIPCLGNCDHYGIFF